MINFINSNITVFYRGGLACLTSIVLMIVLGKYFINIVKFYTQPIRKEGMQTHFTKSKTPTFGGVLMFFVYVVSLIIWSKINSFIEIILISSLIFALIGFLDDILKLKNKSSKGLNVKLRLLLGFIAGVIISYGIVHNYSLQKSDIVLFPLIKYFYIHMGIYIYIWIAFVIVGTANSVNFTDGLDGLASKISIVVLITLSLVIVFLGIKGFPSVYNNLYNLIDYKLNEIFVVSMSLIGVLIGFLWYNSYPARIFMGDVGSLFIGSAIGTIALCLKFEIILVFSGIIFVLETLSVIIQVLYYKSTKRRIFLMAPLHHHYEKKGFSETMVVNKFWIITIIMSIASILLIRG